ncbi:MAG: PEP-CTERM sorting domain-containing protein, partial [Candidatus Spyradosoma sp.]
FTIGTVAEGVTVTAFGGTLAGTQFTAGTVANVSADDSGAISQENQSVAANTSVTISQKSDTVTLSTASTAITVSKAESLDTRTISVSEIGAVVLSAWSFDITNSGADVMVTLDVGETVSVDAVRVYHKSDDEGAKWEDVTKEVGNLAVSKDGKVSFTTKSFSSYAVASVPEPSTFGLLAGLGALALVAARRRRQKNA